MSWESRIRSPEPERVYLSHRLPERSHDSADRSRPSFGGSVVHVVWAHALARMPIFQLGTPEELDTYFTIERVG
jgi:hypothetical protein